jgi:hypothetical protein
LIWDLNELNSSGVKWAAISMMPSILLAQYIADRIINSKLAGIRKILFKLFLKNLAVNSFSIVATTIFQFFGVIDLSVIKTELL